jgi:HEAT repeat protein
MALHSLSCATCKLVPLQHDEDLVAFVIERALTDPSVNVRRHATTALGSFCQDPRATRALQRLAAQDADRAVRRNAQRALRSSLIPAAQD